MADGAPARLAVISGHFNPLHLGHLRLMSAARDLADSLVVIVSNDHQQMLKKGRIIQPAEHRLAIVQALRIVDFSYLACDTGPSVCETLAAVIRPNFPNASLMFVNGGDRNSAEEILEAECCLRHNIELVFLGKEKIDSSSRIVAELERRQLP